jgi:guanine nucleotide exchange factor
MFLPNMRKKTSNPVSGSDDGETLMEFWLIDNMYTFENVGFSNTVGTIKYLICADCEIGPIGWHDITNTSAYFVALERVDHR